MEFQTFEFKKAVIFSIVLNISFPLRTTTLNDIYRTMGISRNFNTADNNQTSIDKKQLSNRNDHYLDDLNDEEYEEGDVSGYIVQRPILNNGITSNVS